MLGWGVSYCKATPVGPSMEGGMSMGQRPATVGIRCLLLPPSSTQSPNSLLPSCSLVAFKCPRKWFSQLA